MHERGIQTRFGGIHGAGLSRCPRWRLEETLLLGGEHGLPKAGVADVWAALPFGQDCMQPCHRDAGMNEGCQVVGIFGDERRCSEGLPRQGGSEIDFAVCSEIGHGGWIARRWLQQGSFRPIFSAFFPFEPMLSSFFPSSKTVGIHQGFQHPI